MAPSSVSIRPMKKSSKSLHDQIEDGLAYAGIILTLVGAVGLIVTLIWP